MSERTSAGDFSPPHDAIVVLGCKVGELGLSPAAERRVERAAALWHAGVAPRIVVSGGKRWAGITEAEAFARRLTELGVQPDLIECELQSHTTRENMLFTRAMLGRCQPVAKRLALVTCDFHMRRALALFRAGGLDVEGFAALSPNNPLWKRLLRFVKEELGRRRDLRRVV